MTPLLATNYGNMYVFLLGVPALAIAIILGVTGIFFRLKLLAVSCGVVVSVLALAFFVSLKDAEGDSALTVSFGIFCILAAIPLIFLERKPKK